MQIRPHSDSGVRSSVAALLKGDTKEDGNRMVGWQLVERQLDAAPPDGLTNGRRNQCIELVPKFGERRVGVKLRIPRRQAVQKSLDVRRIYPAILQNTEDPDGVPESGPACGMCPPPRQSPEHQPVTDAVSQTPARQAQVQPERIPRQPDGANPPLRCPADQNREHGRMQVEMKVAVDVVEG